MLSRGVGGGGAGMCGAFNFSEEFLVKIPTVGPQNSVKSDQISPPFNAWFSDEKRVGIINNPHNPQSKVFHQVYIENE